MKGFPLEIGICPCEYLFFLQGIHVPINYEHIIVVYLFVYKSQI
jgi:hypothetical protein